MSDSFRLRPEVEWRLVEGEVLALDVPAQMYLSANRTGAVLWSSLARGATRDQLVATLVAAFDVDQDVAARDVDAFLGALAARGLLAGPP